jgi:signal transduction histidine kinase
MEKRDTWLRGLTAVLVVFLVLTVLALYLPRVIEEPIAGLPAPETHAVAAVGLLGLVLVFVLYVLQTKFRQSTRFRRDLLNMRIREELLRGHLSEITTLFEPGALRNMRIDLDAALQLIIERIVDCLDADQGSILLLDPETGELRGRAACGDEASLALGARIPIGSPIAGTVAERRVPMIIDDDVMAKHFPTEFKRGRKIASALSIPLLAGQNFVGVININRSNRERPFAAADVRPVKLFAERIADTVLQLQTSHHPAEPTTASSDVQHKMERLERIRRLLLTSLDHEVQTRLNNLVKASQALGGAVPAQRGEVLSNLNEQARRLRDSVAEIIELAQLESGSLRLELNPVSINRIATDALNAMKLPAKRADIQLEQSFDWSIPSTPCDSLKLRRVLLHLLTNALKFSEPGSAVRVRTERVDDEIVVHVEDRGAGLPPDDLARAFDLFARGKRAMAESIDGIGLGLYLVKRFVEHHKGRVWAKSVLGKGSRFSFSLPIDLTPSTALDQAEETSPKVPPQKAA